MEKHMFLETVADGRTAAPWDKGKKNCKHSPRVRFWVGPHWVGPWALVEWRKGPPLHGSRSSMEIKLQNASCQMGGGEVTGR